MASIKSKKVKRINKKTMIATFDIGKNVHYGYFRAPDGRECKPFSFPCKLKFWLFVKIKSLKLNTLVFELLHNSFEVCDIWMFEFPLVIVSPHSTIKDVFPQNVAELIK